MPDLVQSLQGRDLGHLRIIADHWGLDSDAPDARIGLQRLVALMVNKEILLEVIQALPEGAGRALQELYQNDGRISWASFTRRYGAVREMGAVRRDRERPYLNQLACATEALWYRGLVARAFFDTLAGPEEFAYIPEDILELIPREEHASEIQSLGRPATPLEKAYLLATSDRILDDACTLLAGLRQRFPLNLLNEHFLCAQNAPYPLKAEVLRNLLVTAGLMAGDGTPRPETIREFLEASRGHALLRLFKGWLHSPDFNELRLMPQLEIEGEWENDPLLARGAALDFLSGIPGSLAGQRDEKDRPFWSISAFLSSIHQSSPDYQRPAGDYDSWFIRDKRTGKFLRGFENWDEVDGALLRFIIAAPLFWLGIVELGLDAAPKAGSSPTITAFRYSAWACELLNFKPPSGLTLENEQVSVYPDGRIRVPLGAPRAARYQIARFSEWEGFAQDAYRYHLTPSSLETARKQGLRVQHLSTLLRRVSRGIPAGLVKALERWETFGSEARAERVTILRVANPEIIQALRTSKAARFLGEAPDPKMVIIRPGAWEKIAAVLAEMGYLSEIKVEGDDRGKK
jgi:hypothetical protein